MEENTGKRGFKVIGVTALILKTITIITIISLIIIATIFTVRNIIETKEIENSQIIAEIEYTDDVNDFSDLDLLQDIFKLKIYDKEKANNNIIPIASIAGINCIFEFILLIFIFDSVQKIFMNLYKTDDVHKTIKDYIKYYNNERLAYSLQYKSPVQYRTELSFN